MGSFWFVGVTLPIGEHLYLGPKDSIFNLHLDTVLFSLLVTGILLAVGLWIRRNVTSGKPGYLQNAVESIISFLNGIIEENLGRDPGNIASIALTLFFFIWLSNLIGLVPIPQIHSPTSDINSTFALAILVFFLMHNRYLHTSGLAAYKGHYWRSGWKGWVTGLNIASLLLAIVNELSRPLTLAFRLFGNILAGEILLIVWAFLLPAAFGGVATLLWNPIFVAYGIFVGTIQAFIFTVLTIAYMAIASEPAHEH